MPTRVKLGIAREFYDEEGNLKFPGPGLQLLENYPHIEHHVLAENNPEISAEQIGDCDMVISGATRWTETSLVGNDQLIAVLFTGVGYDHIDVKALTKANTMLCFAPDAVQRPMATTILTLTLALATRLLEKDKLTREGRWLERGHYHGQGLTGKALGSIGVGNIGRELFKLVAPFGMKHLACDPYITQQAVDDLGVKLVDMDALLAESDYLSVSVPLSDKTYHLVGEAEFKRMKPTAYFISTSRGSIIDEPALIRALEEGWIRGAGLDVFEQEPVDPSNPLLRMDNVVVSPHSLCHTEEFFKLTWSSKLRQADQVSRGEIPPEVVNKDVLEKPPFKRKFEKYLKADSK